MGLTLVGVGLLTLGGVTVWRSTRGGSGGHAPYRAGPWPGLSPAGGLVVLGCALLLAGGQLVVGDPRRPLPNLPVLAIVAVCPMALATRLVQAPGVASAACGAYLLPRALLSVVAPSIEPPPLLLVAAFAFDVCAWLRATDITNLRHVWPRRRSAWRRRVGPRRVGMWRAALAGAVFGAVLASTEPSYAALLGAEPGIWAGADLWLASGLATLGCAIGGLAAASGPAANGPGRAA